MTAHITEITTQAAATSGGRPKGIACLIGERTRVLRRKKGLTRRALSENAAISERYLALLEKGSGNVSILLLERIAHALDVRLSDLVAEPDSPAAG